MRAFAALLETLAFTPSRTGKLRLLQDHFTVTPDPDRGWALGALTGGIDLPGVKAGVLRAMAEARHDAELFRLSYDFVGDLAETIALIWEAGPAREPPALHSVIARLQATPRAAAGAVVADYLDSLGAGERLALVKLATGGLRVGVSARLAQTALAGMAGREADEITAIWHGLTPPYTALFAWIEGRGPQPGAGLPAPFRPVMLAHPLEAAEAVTLDLAAFQIEWKWDGIRVQAVTDGLTRRLYSRSGEDISAAFPDLLAGLGPEAVIDGELLVGRPGPQGLEPGSFSDLQQRLNRTTVARKLMESHPAMLRAYDLLSEGSTDLRALPLHARRARLEALVPRLDPARVDLSPLIAASDPETLARLRTAPPHPVIEGVMLKRRDSPYLPGRPKGHWFKWKRDPYTVDAVLIYARRGHGKRSGLYSDYTFAVWAGDALVPVGKAYSGFTDAELREIDAFVRANTLDRFGPVRSVRATPEDGLVFEVAFEGLQRSPRHRSGLAMRFPRISRLRRDKRPGEADRIETLLALLAAPD